MSKEFVCVVIILFTVMSFTLSVSGSVDTFEPVSIDGFVLYQGSINWYEGSDEHIAIPSKPNVITHIKSLRGPYCEGIKSVNIPGSISRIDYSAFDYCINLEIITVDDDNLYYSSKDGMLFNKDKTELLYYPKGKVGNFLEIPEGVVKIGANAFGGDRNLTSVTIPSSVVEIEPFAFSGNKSEYVIYGDSRSYAEDFAKQKNIAFRDKNKPSPWAITEIEEAKKHNLTTEKVLYNFQQNLTREEFCELSIKLYEALSGKKADLPAENPFGDTKNTEILKAYTLGIVNGRGDGIFAPNDLLTRQEVAVISVRTIEAIDEGIINTETYSDKLGDFEDKNDVAAWAYNELSVLVDLDIFHGISSTKLDPKGNTTREQGIALVKRVFERINLIG